MQRIFSSISFSRFAVSNVRRLISQSSTVLCKDNKPVDVIDFEEDRGPPIPTYEMKDVETLETKKARLLYQSRKRGMLENCVLLSTFANKYLDEINDQQTRLYDQLINLPSNDWDIFYWASNIKPTPPEFDNEVMELLKKHVANTDRELRQQPDLKVKDTTS